MTDTPAEELAKMWQIFTIDQQAPISLRAISPKGAPVDLRTMNITFTAADYPKTGHRQGAFADEALRLNELGYNVYTPLNPIKPSFEGDRRNDLAVCDEHIACRHRLLIDLDRSGVLDAPATEAEIDAAREVGDHIAAFLLEEFSFDPLRVMSGNGIHLYLRLDNFPNDAVSKKSCQKLLHALAKRFNTETIKVDTGVFNASRITKVPGTIARKGLATSDRPHRMACVL